MKERFHASQALGENRNTSFATIMKVLGALSLKLQAAGNRNARLAGDAAITRELADQRHKFAARTAEVVDVAREAAWLVG